MIGCTYLRKHIQMSQKTLDSLLELKIKESMFQRKAIRVKSKIGTLRLRHKVEKLKKQDEKKTWVVAVHKKTDQQQFALVDYHKIQTDYSIDSKRIANLFKGVKLSDEKILQS
jgi:hypothetical protein